jgi:hypothetical protein
MKKIFNIIFIVLIVSFCIACNDDVVKNPDEFLKEKEALPWLPALSDICNIKGKEGVVFVANNGYSICFFDIEKKRIDTLISKTLSRVSNFCYNSNNETIWMQLDDKDLNLWNSKIGSEVACPFVKHYEEQIVWLCGGNHPFFSCGDIVYTGFIPIKSLTAEFKDYAKFRAKSNLIAVWDVSNTDSVKCVSLFGERPSDQPKEMFIDDSYTVAFNVEDSIIIAGTELSQNVIVMTMMGEKLKEKKFTSKFYTKPEKRDFSQEYSATEKIKYWENNMLFRSLYYDKYRKLYYRVLDMGICRNKESFMKQKSDWVLIVADSELNKKYEVFFDGDDYRAVIFIGKEGVYVRTTKNKTMDLFVFD